MDNKTVFIIDDDQTTLSLLETTLHKAGFSVVPFTSAGAALQRLDSEIPDCIITDIMLPGMDGMEFIRRVRALNRMVYCKIICLSCKPYDYDKHQAASLGADAYLVKPVNPEAVLTTITTLMTSELELQFWGVHGTLTMPGPDTVRYGGDTNCVTLKLRENTYLIFDAGTGLKIFGRRLMQAKAARIKGTFLITHPHLDHLAGFPFFVPFYVPGNEFEVTGPAQGAITMRQVISGQMDSIYFPITIREFTSRVYFRDLVEGRYEFDGAVVRTMLLTHPGYCLGYRVEYHGKSVCYITDNELYPEGSAGYSEEFRGKLVDFTANADILIHDTTYVDRDYRNRMNWGHSALGEVVGLALKAGVKKLCLYHHDPDDTDNQIDTKLNQANDLIAASAGTLACCCPAEQEIILT